MFCYNRSFSFTFNLSEYSLTVSQPSNPCYEHFSIHQHIFRLHSVFHTVLTLLAFISKIFIFSAYQQMRSWTKGTDQFWVLSYKNVFVLITGIGRVKSETSVVLLPLKNHKLAEPNWPWWAAPPVYSFWYRRICRVIYRSLWMWYGFTRCSKWLNWSWNTRK